MALASTRISQPGAARGWPALAQRANPATHCRGLSRVASSQFGRADGNPDREESGYSVRSVFERFSDLDTLSVAAADYALEHGRADAAARDVDGDRPTRIRSHVHTRATACEKWLAAMARHGRHPGAAPRAREPRRCGSTNHHRAPAADVRGRAFHAPRTGARGAAGRARDPSSASRAGTRCAIATACLSPQPNGCGRRQSTACLPATPG